MLDSCKECGTHEGLTECPECEEIICEGCWQPHQNEHTEEELDDDDLEPRPPFSR
jgi:hypothetical protein